MDQLFAVKFSYLIPLLPLLGAMVAGLFGAKYLKQQSHWPIWIGVGLSALLSLSLLVGMFGLWRDQEPNATPAHEVNLSTTVKWFDWIVAGGESTDFTKHTNADVGTADGTTQKIQPTFYAQAGAWIDPLTAVMLCVITCIGLLITIFAAGYMKGEEGYFRFFAYLGLFIFAMTCLVLGNNFVMLYLGWEGVGLCSYLLIGYYYEKPSAREAAKKAFLVNRVGDFGFSLGIMLTYLAFGTISYFGAGAGTMSGVLEIVTAPVSSMTHFQQSAMNWIPFLLMVGAFGKSAQFPLYVWLPDAMEGPTPVSALIHAATMVTAGVYMIARCSTLFVTNNAALVTVAAVGAFTALFAATIALRQFDLKKVFAYSTVSQLGYMFVGVGVLAPVAGVFHLVTHAFFKALLFLSSGVVMHAMAGELDMRKMSGLKRTMPWTNLLMLTGCLALAGFPFFSGFFSKDDIIGAAFGDFHHLWGWVLGLALLLAAFLTAYYTFRLYFRVFQGPEIIPPAPATAQGHDDHGHDSHANDAHGHTGHHNHEPMLMIAPLIVLAIGAILAGYLNWPEREHTLGDFLGQSPSYRLGYQKATDRFTTLASAAADPESRPVESNFGQELRNAADVRIPERTGSPFTPVMAVSALIALLGIGMAYHFHLKDRPAGDRLPQRFPAINRVLENKYWVDEIYQAGIVTPLRRLGSMFFVIDQLVIDGMVTVIGFIIPQATSLGLKRATQRGFLQGYAATMLFGVAVIVLVVFW